MSNNTFNNNRKLILFSPDLRDYITTIVTRDDYSWDRSLKEEDNKTILQEIRKTYFR